MSKTWWTLGAEWKGEGNCMRGLRAILASETRLGKQEKLKGWVGQVGGLWGVLGASGSDWKDRKWL